MTYQKVVKSHQQKFSPQYVTKEWSLRSMITAMQFLVPNWAIAAHFGWSDQSVGTKLQHWTRPVTQCASRAPYNRTWPWQPVLEFYTPCNISATANAKISTDTTHRAVPRRWLSFLSRYSQLFVESRRFWPTPPAFGAPAGSRISQRFLASEN